MTAPAEVVVRGLVAHGRTLLECEVCGPVAVTDLALERAIDEHVTEHEAERSNR